MKILFIALFLVTTYLGIGQKNMLGTNTGLIQKQIPVIDKENPYPEIDCNPQMEVTYIPLETNKDILLDKDAHIYYVSDKIILITNSNRGDVFIFDRNGKAVSHFNQKGGLGYTRINYAVYDEENKEIFIMDKVTRKIVVFTEEGSFKRSFNMPPNMILKKLDNFDENLLLAWHEEQFGPLEQRQPYILISKKDGGIISKLNITLDKANPRYLLSGNICYKLGNNAMGNYKFGQEFFLANMSSDTIYHLKQDKTLTPLFVQRPTVFSDSPVITGVVMKTDDFIILSVYSYDLKAEKRRTVSGNNGATDDDIKFLMYEFNTGRFFKCKKWKYLANNVDLPKNMSVKLIQTYQLINRLKLGVLEGKLKELVTNLNADDNPVVEITKFK